MLFLVLKVIESIYYEIPHFDSFTIAQILANNSLYVVAKCYSLAFKEFKESTQAMTIEKWLISNGYNYDNKYYYNLKENIQKLGFYMEYDMLSLACLYGGNNRSFNIIKPFIVPKDYIQDCFYNNNYMTGKIDEFIKKLKTEGFIEI